MAYIITPSEKARTKTNPQPVASTYSTMPSKISLVLKNVFGTPIPILLFVYGVALLLSTSLLELSSWAILAFSFLYILVDQFCKRKELRMFRTGFDLSLFFFLTFSIFSYVQQQNVVSWFDLVIFLKWPFWLIILTYTFNLFPGLNKYLQLIFYFAPILCVIFFVQHALGISILPSLYDLGIQQDWAKTWSFTILSQPFVFGLVSSLLCCVSLAAFWLHHREELKFHPFYAALSFVFLVAAFIAYDLRVWMTLVICLLSVSFLVRKKYFFITLFALIIGIFIFSQFVGRFREDVFMVIDNYKALQEQSHLQNEETFKVIQETIWTGQGIPSYLASEFKDTAQKVPAIQNNFLIMLKYLGVFGLLSYLFFVLSGFLLSFRLLGEIPRTHFWHLVIVVASIAIQLSFHICGLFYATFFQFHLQAFYLFFMAILAHMSESYGRGIVPDDRSL